MNNPFRNIDNYYRFGIAFAIAVAVMIAVMGTLVIIDLL